MNNSASENLSEKTRAVKKGAAILSIFSLIFFLVSLFTNENLQYYDALDVFFLILRYVPAVLTFIYAVNYKEKKLTLLILLIFLIEAAYYIFISISNVYYLKQLQEHFSSHYTFEYMLTAQRVVMCGNIIAGVFFFSATVCTRLPHVQKTFGTLAIITKHVFYTIYYCCIFSNGTRFTNTFLFTIIADILSDAALLIILFKLAEDLPQKAPSPQKIKPKIVNFPEKKALELLKDKLELMIITKDEYEEQRGKIINDMLGVPSEPNKNGDAQSKNLPAATNEQQSYQINIFNEAPQMNNGNQQQNGAKACPKCGSTNLQIISDTQTDGKDFSAEKGCCGWVLFGPIGLLCGACGEEKTTETTHYWVCKNCGHKWKL